MMLFPAANHVYHMEKMLGLSIEPDWHESIISHFSALENAAEQIMRLDLPTHTEAAMTYQLPNALFVPSKG